MADDIELTKVVAEAMGYTKWGDHFGGMPGFTKETGVYDPLHDDAQAMALVKRFRLSLEGGYDGGALLESEKTWTVEHNDGEQATVQTNHDRQPLGVAQSGQSPRLGSELS